MQDKKTNKISRMEIDTLLDVNTKKGSGVINIITSSSNADLSRCFVPLIYGVCVWPTVTASVEGSTVTLTSDN